MIRALFRSTRPGQWVKNAFVFIPILFAKQLFQADGAMRGLAAFWVFTLASAGVYLMNDVADRERDRAHPEKRLRPVATGALRVGPAIAAAVLLAGGAVALGTVLAPSLGLVLLVYVAIQLGYSLGLRQIVILDVFCIAAGFVLRVLAGAAAVHVFVSSWLILTIIFLSLFLALCKRRAEVMALPAARGDTRRTLLEYRPEFLDGLISVTTTAVVLCYSLYTVDPLTVAKMGGSRDLVLTVPFVIYGIFRYLFLVHRRERGESPTAALLRDVPLLVNTALWAGAVAAIVSFGPQLPKI